MNKFENNQAETETPSFSSFVLDKILHSIDEEDRKISDKKFYTETTVNKMSKINAKSNRFNGEEPNLRLNIGTQMHHDPHGDQDVMLFSSPPSSSGSSFGLLSSSSDTETIYRAKSLNPCFAHSNPKPVKITVLPERSIARDEDIFMKQKSRVMKLYNNLKKVKQSISPGGKLTSFLSSFFINTKKTTSIDKSRNGTRRTVRFSHVSVIIDEDNRVCRNKCLHGGEDSGLTATTAWRIGRTVSKKKEEEVLNMNKRVDQVLREFHLNRKFLRDFSMRNADIGSSSSSDFSELDHLALIGNDRYYYEDLPVFETTHIFSNRAIRIM